MQALEQTDFAFQFARFRQDRRGARQKRLAIRGRRGHRVPAVEKCYPQRFLQTLNAARKRGLGQMLRFSGAVKITVMLQRQRVGELL